MSRRFLLILAGGLMTVSQLVYMAWQVHGSSSLYLVAGLLMLSSTAYLIMNPGDRRAIKAFRLIFVINAMSLIIFVLRPSWVFDSTWHLIAAILVPCAAGLGTVIWIDGVISRHSLKHREGLGWS